MILYPFLTLECPQLWNKCLEDRQARNVFKLYLPRKQFLPQLLVTDYQAEQDIDKSNIFRIKYHHQDCLARADFIRDGIDPCGEAEEYNQYVTTLSGTIAI